MRALLLLGCLVSLVVIGCAKPVVTSPAKVQSVDAKQAWQEIADGALVVDVRSPEEYSSGHVEGALNVPHDQVQARIAEFGADKSREVVLYCRSGRRAGVAAETLISNGFTNVLNAGGYSGLAEAK